MKQVFKPANRFFRLCRIVCVAVFLCALPPVSSALQTDPPADRETLSGTVTELMKYSFRIQSGEMLREITSTPRTEYRQRIVRPTFELEQGRIRCEVAASGSMETGNVNLFVDIAVSTPLYLRGWFRHEQELTRCWESGGQRRLVNYILTDKRPEQFQPPGPDHLNFAGEIESIDSRSVATIRFGDLVIPALLLERDASLDRGSITDLEPFITEVQATVSRDGEKWIAEEVVFTRLLDPLAGEVPGLPRCLVLGDEMSLSTFGPLRSNHGEIANFWHPPENCRGGENRERLAVWLGPYQSPGRQWDVIVFNFGQANLSATDEEYAEMLKEWIAVLGPTGARLVWVQTVPRLPARAGAELKQMERLNRLAVRFFDAHPDVTICDPSAGVEPQEMARMDPAFWWARCARLVAESVDLAIKKN